MAEEEFEDAPTSKMSKINAAALINLTIADLWKDSYRHSRLSEFSKWNADLNCLWIEFAGDIKEGREEEIEFLKIDRELATQGNLSRRKVDGFRETSQEEMKQYAKQYMLLLKKAVFLKRLQNKQGKGTAYQDKSDYYMD